MIIINNLFLFFSFKKVIIMTYSLLSPCVTLLQNAPNYLGSCLELSSNLKLSVQAKFYQCMKQYTKIHLFPLEEKKRVVVILLSLIIS